MVKPVLELVDVSCGTTHDYELEAITLSIGAGERLAIVGANGSGKSTLARLFAGDLDPTSGTIGGTCSRGVDVGTAPNLVGTDPAQTVRDIIASDVPGAEPRDVLASLALPSELIDRRVLRLSGGERYRLAVALLLARRPPILVLDAPTAALDASSTAALVDALGRHRGAVVILSADLSLAAEVCRRAVLLADGKIVAEGSPAELLTDAELLKRHGLQLPAAVSPSWLRRRARRAGLSVAAPQSRAGFDVGRPRQCPAR